MGLKRGDPLTNGAPLVIISLDCGVAPLDGHATCNSGPLRPRRNIAQSEGWGFFQFPAPMVGSDLNGLNGCEAVPGLGMSAAWRQIDFESLINDRDAFLELPDVLVDV